MIRTFAGVLTLSGFLLVLFPGVDLLASGLIYSDGHFILAQNAFATWLKDKISLLMMIAGISLFGCMVLAFWRGNHSQRKKALYLFLAMALGPGLVTNAVFKDHWGRARPRDIVEFGGTRQFTPALSIAAQCRKNCSFYSGHAAVGFFWVSLAFVTGRRFLFFGGFFFGWLVGLLRWLQGAHYLSDIVFAAFFTIGISYLLARAFGLDFSLCASKTGRIAAKDQPGFSASGFQSFPCQNQGAIKAKE